MKKSEAIEKYREAIASEMIEKYQSVLDSNGNAQYQIYVWEDGEIETLCGPQGDNSYLAPRQYETRQLFYVTTIDMPCFDPWDFSDHSRPDDEIDQEKERKEIIDWLIDDYRDHLDDLIGEICADAEYTERMEADYERWNNE